MPVGLILWHFEKAGDFLRESWGVRDLPRLFDHVDELAYHLPGIVGPYVAVIWIATRLAGCRRAEAGWCDRAGRFLGWCWVALWLVNGVRLILEGTSKK